MTKQESLISMDSAYGSIPRTADHELTAGEMVIYTLFPEEQSFTNSLFLHRFIARFSQGRAIDHQSLLEYLSPTGAPIDSIVLDKKVVYEFAELSYKYLDSHLLVALFRFLLQFSIEEISEITRAGLRYCTGKDLKMDHSKAISWFRKAVANVVNPASVDASQALACLGLCHFKGHGVEESVSKGLNYFMEATRYSSNTSKISLIEFAAKMLKGHCEPKLLQWLNPLVDASYPPAQYLLGSWYFHGKHGLDQDKSKAVALFIQAAAQGYAPAQFDLGKCYSYGIEVDKNTQESVKWLARAACQNYWLAQNELDNHEIPAAARLQLRGALKNNEVYCFEDPGLASCISWHVLSL